MDAFEIVVLILALTLAVFLLLSIVVVVLIIHILRQIKQITDKAQNAVDYAESVGRTLATMSTPAFVAKAVMRQVQQFLRRNKEE